MLYNMWNLDEMQRTQELSENTSLQSYELQDLRRNEEEGEEVVVVEEEEKEEADENDSFVMIDNTHPASELTPHARAMSTSALDQGHRVGNFSNPEFNPSAKERTSHIPDGAFELVAAAAIEKGNGLSYVDVGCSSGELTMDLWAKLEEAYDGGVSAAPGLRRAAVGVDIDAALVDQARTRSLAHDLSVGFASRDPTLTFLAGDAASLPFLSSALDGLGSPRATLVSVLSTTMWLHMHLGDEGFYLWLNYVCSRADHVLVEPQPWRCYLAANELLREMGRPEVDLSGLEELEGVEGRIEEAILTCNFQKVAGAEGEGDGEGAVWGKEIMLFRRVSA